MNTVMVVGLSTAVLTRLVSTRQDVHVLSTVAGIKVEPVREAIFRNHNFVYTNILTSKCESIDSSQSNVVKACFSKDTCACAQLCRADLDNIAIHAWSHICVRACLDQTWSLELNIILGLKLPTLFRTKESVLLQYSFGLGVKHSMSLLIYCKKIPYAHPDRKADI